MNMKTTIELTLTCKVCHKEHTVNVDATAYSRFLCGMLACDAFPEMAYEEMQLIVNHLCPKCYGDLPGDTPECDYCLHKRECDNCIL